MEHKTFKKSNFDTLYFAGPIDTGIIFVHNRYFGKIG